MCCTVVIKQPTLNMVGGFCYISIYNYSNACLVIEKTKLILPKDTTTTFL